jgi:hypothetical protein
MPKVKVNTATMRTIPNVAKLLFITFPPLHYSYSTKTQFAIRLYLSSFLEIVKLPVEIFETIRQPINKAQKSKTIQKGATLALSTIWRKTPRGGLKRQI